MDRVTVEPESRQRGFGAALYAHIEALKGDPPLVCEVGISPTSNAESIIFHEKMGFGTLDHFSPDGIKTCRMYIKY